MPTVVVACDFERLAQKRIRRAAEQIKAPDGPLEIKLSQLQAGGSYANNIKQAYLLPGGTDTAWKADNDCVEILQRLSAAGFSKAQEFLNLPKRSAENGGPKLYKDVEELYSDYATEALHPKDLKDSLKIKLDEVLKPLVDVVKGDAELKKALKELDTFGKKKK